MATALAARTTTFKPLIAIRPGYWQPAQFASAAATLDQLSGGRVLVNIVSGVDNLAAYGDTNILPAQRYARTQEFLHLLRRLWTEESVTFTGEHFRVESSTVAPPPYLSGDRMHRTLYFGGASEAAERVAAAEAGDASWAGHTGAVGQQRLLELADRGEVLDSCLYTTPGKYGAGGAATTWLVGSADEVAAALTRYGDLGITHFILSDTPYRDEIIRIGDHLLPKLRA